MSTLRSPVYVQYGCGICAPASWMNFDASPTLLFERLPLIGRLHTRNAARFPPNVRFGDIRRGLAVPDSTATGIYCSHILEHLSRHDCELALRNTLALLAPGGICRLVVPDLRALAAEYMSGNGPDAAHRFMDELGMGTSGKRGVVTQLKHDVLGNSKHLWMWDEASLTQLLAATGFDAIRRCRFNDCADARFNEVENEERFDKSLALECRRAP